MLRLIRSLRFINSHGQKAVWIIFYIKLKKGIKKVGISLSSQAASSQVFSASSSLTTVFEMGTGVPWISSTPTSILYHACFILSRIFSKFLKKIFYFGFY